LWQNTPTEGMCLFLGYLSTECDQVKYIDAPIDAHNCLSVTPSYISFGAPGFRSAAPAIWNSLPCNVCSCETLTTFRDT